MKRVLYKCIGAVLCLSLLAGCSSGSIYSNYRETEQLMVVQTMGFDESPKGFSVSVSTGGEEKITRMAAEAESITLAEQKMQDYSAAEEIFYAHTSYIAIGESAARSGLSHYMDFIGRSTQMRMDTPLFVVTGGNASELVLGSGNEEYDATDVLKSLERNISRRGDLQIFTAGEVAAQLDRNGSALICAVRCVQAKDSLYGSQEELTAVPDGYAVIKDRKMIGRISYHDALAVGIIQNKAGPCRLTVSSDEGNAALQLDDCICRLEPVYENGELRGLSVDVKLRTALLERGDAVNLDAVAATLKKDIGLRLENVLKLSKLTGCDFLQLCSRLQVKQPFSSGEIQGEFQELLPHIYYIINVSAEIDRSFDADREENA
ncbi:MAG: Ger(x)C family spore germination C-terminal domain-containing protein [Bacillota bacterium]|nr:Ger(x)C family spore germination C-terminal domain-containing protein [Bacillota bacterium]